MYRKYFFLIIINLMSFSFIYSQGSDKVYFKNKTVVEGKILNVTTNTLEIDPIGDKPFLVFNRDEVEVIIYSDNTVVKFDNNTVNNSNLATNKYSFNFSDAANFEISDKDNIISKYHTHRFSETFQFENNITLVINGSFNYKLYETGYLTTKLTMTFYNLNMTADLFIEGKKYTAPVKTVDDLRQDYKDRHFITGDIGSIPLYIGDDININNNIYLDVDFSRYSYHGFNIQVVLFTK